MWKPLATFPPGSAFLPDLGLSLCSYLPTATATSVTCDLRAGATEQSCSQLALLGVAAGTDLKGKAGGSGPAA